MLLDKNFPFFSKQTEKGSSCINKGYRRFIVPNPACAVSQTRHYNLALQRVNDVQNFSGESL